MADLRPPLSAPATLFGVTARILPRDGAPVEAVVIDCGHRPEAGTVGAAGATVDLRKRISIARADVPELPVGSLIEANFDGTGLRAWRVDREDFRTPDEFRVWVSPGPVVAN